MPGFSIGRLSFLYRRESGRSLTQHGVFQGKSVGSGSSRKMAA